MTSPIPQLSAQELDTLRGALIGNSVNLRAWFEMLTDRERMFSVHDAREEVAKLSLYLFAASEELAAWHARLVPIARDENHREERWRA